METFTNFKSSNVAAVAYEPKTRELQIEFKNGSRYAYEGVTPKRWHDLQHAKSIGGFVHSKIVAQHPGKKLGVAK